MLALYALHLYSYQHLSRISSDFFESIFAWGKGSVLNLWG